MWVLDFKKEKITVLIYRTVNIIYKDFSIISCRFSNEATINDYAWNESYSRSIGVDIRFILWFTQKFGGADYILKEMGIKNI